MTFGSNRKASPLGARLAVLAAALGGMSTLLGGCATGNTGEVEPTPHVLALSTYEASVGTPIDVYGTNFPTAESGRLSLVFDGLWRASDGTEMQVYKQFPLVRVNAGLARWTGFGPYKVPFGNGDRIGTFEGRMFVEFESRDGTEILTDAEPRDVSFTVTPSVLVHEFQPTTANCAGPILRGIGGLPYRLRVEAVGFEPETFTYSMETPALDRTRWSMRRLAAGRFDELGGEGDFRLPDVPADEQFYSSIMVIQGTDAAGNTFTNSFALGVRRPIEVFYNGNVQPVEFYAPTPETSCNPGGETSRDYTWTNTTEETEQRGYEVNWSNNWDKTVTVEQSSSRTVGASVVNGIGFSTTDSVSFNWGTQSEINGTVKFDFLIEAGIGGRRNYIRDQGIESSSTTERTRQEGIEVSETTTETEGVSESEGGTEGEGYSMVASSSESIGKSFSGQIVAGYYGVIYTQKVRLVRKASVVTYNQCGEAQPVGEVDFTDWKWSVDLAVGKSCPPFPESNLPPAQCVVPEACSGEL